MTTTIDLYRLAKKSNIDIDNFKMREVESASFPEGWVVIDESKIKSRLDEKLHIAHELGHCFTGSFYNEYSAFDIRSKHERQADIWAIKKLVPKNEMYAAYDAGIIELWQLAEYFDVPCYFMRNAMQYYSTEE